MKTIFISRSDCVVGHGAWRQDFSGPTPKLVLKDNPALTAKWEQAQGEIQQHPGLQGLLTEFNATMTATPGAAFGNVGVQVADNEVNTVESALKSAMPGYWITQPALAA